MHPESHAAIAQTRENERHKSQHVLQRDHNEQDHVLRESQADVPQSSADAAGEDEESIEVRPYATEQRLGVDMKLQSQDLKKAITFEGLLVVPAAVRSPLDMLHRASCAPAFFPVLKVPGMGQGNAQRVCVLAKEFWVPLLRAHNLGSSMPLSPWIQSTSIFPKLLMYIRNSNTCFCFSCYESVLFQWLI